MIKFNLICAQNHEFEGWFRDGATYDAQSAGGEVSCPVCASASVRKAPMAPSVVSSKRAAAAASQDSTNLDAANQTADSGPESMADIHQALLKLRQHIEQNADNVGDRFPEEARRIHYGETKGRPIFGQASGEEKEALREEGIDIFSVPWVRHDH